MQNWQMHMSKIMNILVTHIMSRLDSQMKPIFTGRITDNLFAIKDRNVNFYIYQTDTGPICFDAGYGCASLEKDFRNIGVIPQEIKHNINGQLYYSYVPEEFKQALKIYTTYQTLSYEYPILLEEISLLNYQLELMSDTVFTCTETLQQVNEDRLLIYKVREEEAKQHEKDKNKQDFRTFLIAGGTGVGALVIGVVIGVLAF